jgi:hypothetical protein
MLVRKKNNWSVLLIEAAAIISLILLLIRVLAVDLQATISACKKLFL